MGVLDPEAKPAQHLVRRHLASCELLKQALLLRIWAPMWGLLPLVDLWEQQDAKGASLEYFWPAVGTPRCLEGTPLASPVLWCQALLPGLPKAVEASLSGEEEYKRNNVGGKCPRGDKGGSKDKEESTQL